MGAGCAGERAYVGRRAVRALIDLRLARAGASTQTTWSRTETRPARFRRAIRRHGALEATRSTGPTKEREPPTAISPPQSLAPSAREGRSAALAGPPGSLPDRWMPRGHPGRRARGRGRHRGGSVLPSHTSRTRYMAVLMTPRPSRPLRTARIRLLSCGPARRAIRGGLSSAACTCVRGRRSVWL